MEVTFRGLEAKDQSTVSASERRGVETRRNVRSLNDYDSAKSAPSFDCGQQAWQRVQSIDDYNYKAMIGRELKTPLPSPSGVLTRYYHEP